MLAQLILGIALLQVPEPAKDYHLPAMTLEEFGQWLGEETGLLAIVNPEVGERDIYVNVKQRTVSELIGLVEKSLDVKILRANGALTFMPATPKGDRPLDREFWDKNLAKMADDDVNEEKLRQKIKQYFEDMRRIQSGEESDNRLYQRIEDAGRSDPTAKIVRDIVRTIGYDGFNAMPNNERIVFSTHPTRLQRAWPVKADPQMAEINRIADIKNRLIDKERNRTTQDEEEGYFYYDSEIGQKYGGKAKPIKAMQLVVRRTNYGVNLEMRFYDETGRQRISSHSVITGTYELASYNDNKEYKEKYADLEGEINLSEEEHRELSNLQRLLYGFGDQGEFSRDDLDFIAGFAKGSPYRYAYTKLLDHSCDATGNEAVLRVFPSYFDLTDRTLSSKAVAQSIFISQEEKRNTLVLNDDATKTYYFIRAELPRKALAWVAQQILSEGVLTLDMLADSVKLVTRREQISNVLGGALQMSGQDAGNTYFDETSWDQFAIEAYAQMNRQQRKAARSPEGLVLESGRMPAGIDWLMREYLKKADLGVSEFSDEEMYEEGEEMSIFYGLWKLEQSVFLVEQSSWPARFTFKIGPKSGVMRQYDYGDFKHSNFEPLENLAWTEYWRSNQESHHNESEQQMKTSFAAAAGDELTMEIQFGGLECTGTAFMLLSNPIGKYGTFEDLPEDLRKQIADQLAKIKREMDGATISPGGGGGTPPPR